MTLPLISVVMPVYNTKKIFLKQAIESILNQTLGDFELLIVNDGSTNPEVDETIKSYHDKRIKYYVIKNSGAAVARNYALDRATGEYVAIMDSDDISLPRRFEKEVAFLKAHPEISVVGANMDLLNEEGIKVGQTDVKPCPKILDVLRGTPVQHSTTMWRRSDLEKLHLRYDPDFKVTQDYEFFSRVVRTFNIANLKEILVQYHIQSNSLFHSNAELAQHNIQIIRGFLLDFLSNNEEIRQKISQLIFTEETCSKHGFLLPRWLGKMICLFIPKKKNRQRFRKNHLNPQKGEKMNIFKKEKKSNGRRHIYLFGIKVLSYKKKAHNSKFDQIYSRRYKGLTKSEIRFCIKKQFKTRLGYSLNLDNPKTFNEKLQWLKLYYHDPLMTKCADKVAVREYIKDKIGEEYLVPCLGVWENPDDIDFNKLPNKFVLKINWGSGQNIIVKDKSILNIEEAREKLRNWMKPENNNYFGGFEWVYKDIQPKIIAEKYIEQMDGKLLDYKFFCFNGKPTYCQIDIDRFTDHTRCFYDMNYKKQDFTSLYPLYTKEISKPSQYSEMLKIAKLLCGDFPHVRVDFFVIGNRIYVGEMTFVHEAGYARFYPQEWDRKLGDLFTLPQKKI